MDFEALRNELTAAARNHTPARALYVMAVLTKAFQAVGYPTPILVGGAAVEYYTEGAYCTQDIDALLYSSSPVVSEVMTALGFQRRGKDWEHVALKLLVEFPGYPGQEEGFLADRIFVSGIEIQIASLESMILDRVHGFHMGHTQDGAVAIALIKSAKKHLDWEFLEGQALREHMEVYLRGLRHLANDIDWSRPPSPDDLEERLYALRNPEAAARIRELKASQESDDDA